MKKYFLILLPVVFGIIVFALGKNQRESENETSQLHSHLESDIQSLIDWYENSWVTAVSSNNEAEIQKAFLSGREKYKEVEWAVEFFFPTTAKDLNGAPLPEIEVEEHIVIEPGGFQVIEELIYPFDRKNVAAINQESEKIKSLLYRLQTLWHGLTWRDDQVWSAIRLNILRMSSLGIAGFDNPLSNNLTKEFTSSLRGMEAVVSAYEKRCTNNAAVKITQLFQSAYAILANNDHQSLDRHHFLLNSLNPISVALLEMQENLKISNGDYFAVDLTRPGFFDTSAFRPDFFVPDANTGMTHPRVALGEKLFRDPILSDNGRISCVSCHLPDKAFTDGLTKSRSFGLDSTLDRNTPTILYSGLQQQQFYDMRVASLEDQVKTVINSSDEIHGSLEGAAHKLKRNSTYIHLFANAFPGDSVTTWNIQVALASYIRSLNPFNSRFDRHMRGQIDFAPEEIRGMNIFLGKGKCGSCHFMPLFNGTIPPVYTVTESEVIGVPGDKKFTALSPDSGRYLIYRIPELRSAFKTPTLRNIELTAPYMHNGVFTTLEEVLDFYDKGGAAGRHLFLENQTLSPDPLNLSEIEKQELISFLKTLTDR